jgi:hypothetical protein
MQTRTGDPNRQSQDGGTAEFAAKPTSSGTIKIMTRALAEHLHPSLAISRQLIWLFSPEARFG